MDVLFNYSAGNLKSTSFVIPVIIVLVYLNWNTILIKKLDRFKVKLFCLYFDNLAHNISNISNGWNSNCLQCSYGIFKLYQCTDSLVNVFNHKYFKLDLSTIRTKKIVFILWKVSNKYFSRYFCILKTLINSFCKKQTIRIIKIFIIVF